LIVIPDLKTIHPGHALGLLIAAALDHLTTRPWCCPLCCPQCVAANFYQEQAAEVADQAVALALGEQQCQDWQHHDGSINWPYLVQFWDPPADHTC